MGFGGSECFHFSEKCFFEIIKMVCVLLCLSCVLFLIFIYFLILISHVRSLSTVLQIYRQRLFKCALNNYKAVAKRGLGNAFYRLPIE
jgi:hypothetical protein